MSGGALRSGTANCLAAAKFKGEGPAVKRKLFPKERHSSSKILLENCDEPNFYNKHESKKGIDISVSIIAQTNKKLYVLQLFSNITHMWLIQVCN